MKPHLLAAAAILASSSPAWSAETWYCEYANFRHTGTDQSLFHVEGNRLIENSGDVVGEYQVLEDSKAAIVATKGGSYASDPGVMGFLLMIQKATGQFLLTTASIGSAGSEAGKQTGHCRPSSGQNARSPSP